MNNKTVTCGVALAFAAGFVLADGWSVQVGSRFQTGMELKLSGSGYANSSGQNYLPGRAWRSGDQWTQAARPDASAVAAPTDDITAYADRTFDNGFVNVSPPTALTGNTWFWGYDAASQYAAPNLTFTRDTSINASGQYADRGAGRQSCRTVSVTDDSGADDLEEFSAAGLEITARREIFVRDAFSVELVAGSSAIIGQEMTLRDQTWAATVRQDEYSTWSETVYDYEMSAGYRETYTYNDPPGMIPLLGVPYAGTYDGPGYAIPELPAARTVDPLSPAVSRTALSREGSGRDLIRRTTWTAHNQIAVDAQISSVAVRTGFRAAFAPRSGVRVFIQPQAALHYMTAELTRNEVIIRTAQDGSQSTTAVWRDTENDESWVPAAGLLAGAGLELDNGWFAEASAGYEWMMDKPEFSVGPSRVRIDLSGLQAAAGLGLRF